MILRLFYVISLNKPQRGNIKSIKEIGKSRLILIPHLRLLGFPRKHLSKFQTNRIDIRLDIRCGKRTTRACAQKSKLKTPEMFVIFPEKADFY